MKHGKGLVNMLAAGAAVLALSVAQGAGIGDLAGGDMSSLASGSAGNAAGVLEFCVKNNYLGGDAAASMKDKLLGKTGGAAGEDSDFSDGAQGLVKTGGGKTVDLASMGKLKSSVTKKGCEAVLKHATSLL